MNQLVVRNGWVLDPASDFRKADVLIENGAIVEVGSVDSSPGRPEIDASNQLVMPGLINAHTHSGQHLDRGVAPNLPLDMWLMWVVYAGVPFTPDDSYTLAMAGALDMLATGCTAVLDHPWVPADGFDQHIEALASAYHDAGIRCGLAPMIQDRDIFESIAFGDLEPIAPLGDPVAPEVLLAGMQRFLAMYVAQPRLTPMVGPSAPQRCSDQLMIGLANLARLHDAPFHTHVLETRSQVVATRQRYGRSVVEYLDAIGALGRRTSLAHAVWMDAEDYRLVASTDATIVHNPVSNLRCGSGVLPLADLLGAGVSVAIGADGAASNDNQNMFEALKLATMLATLAGRFQAWPTASAVWNACLTGGAAAIGAPIGRVEPGARADLVLVDRQRHEFVDREALVRGLVFAEHGESVTTVIVDGAVVVDEGQPLATPAGQRARERDLRTRIEGSLPARLAMLDRHALTLTAIHERDVSMPIDIERCMTITPAFAGQLAGEADRDG